jgi:hypothetical protein
LIVWYRDVLAFNPNVTSVSRPEATLIGSAILMKDDLEAKIEKEAQFKGF